MSGFPSPLRLSNTRGGFIPRSVHALIGVGTGAVSTFWRLCVMLLRMWVCKCLLSPAFLSHLLGKHPEVERLGHVHGDPTFNLVRNLLCFRNSRPTDRPTNSARGSGPSCPPALAPRSQPATAGVNTPQCGLTAPQVVSDAGALSSASGHLNVFLKEMSIQDFCPFFHLGSFPVFDLESFIYSGN